MLGLGIIGFIGLMGSAYSQYEAALTRSAPRKGRNSFRSLHTQHCHTSLRLSVHCSKHLLPAASVPSLGCDTGLQGPQEAAAEW